jgi:hypothetical protein
LGIILYRKQKRKMDQNEQKWDRVDFKKIKLKPTDL